jgi:hypothetical protein
VWWECPTSLSLASYTGEVTYVTNFENVKCVMLVSSSFAMLLFLICILTIFSHYCHHWAVCSVTQHGNANPAAGYWLYTHMYWCWLLSCLPVFNHLHPQAHLW